MNLFKKDPKKLFPNQKHIISKAFSIGKVDYYQFEDVFNLPYERGFMALAVYEEARMKCSTEYLEKHVEEMRAILHENPVNVYKLNHLNEQLAQRLNFTLDVDLLYKLASVVFFDENENPASYEKEYCDRKIAHWKKHKGTKDFFLQMPLQELIPFLRNVDFDLNEYSLVNQEINKAHSESFRLSSFKGSLKNTRTGKNY